MKSLTKIFIIFFFSIFSFSQNDNNYEKYGELFETSEIINYELERDNFLNSSSKVKIEGEILSSCPMKGCWMRISVEKDTVLVRFKDYGFFVPKNGIEGKSTIINGKLSVDTLSIAQLQHMLRMLENLKKRLLLYQNLKLQFHFLLMEF